VRGCDQVRGDATVHLLDAGADDRLTTVVHVGALGGGRGTP